MNLNHLAKVSYVHRAISYLPWGFSMIENQWKTRAFVSRYTCFLRCRFPMWLSHGREVAFPRAFLSLLQSWLCVYRHGDLSPAVATTTTFDPWKYDAYLEAEQVLVSDDCFAPMGIILSRTQMPWKISTQSQVLDNLLPHSIWTDVLS